MTLNPLNAGNKFNTLCRTVLVKFIRWPFCHSKKIDLTNCAIVKRISLSLTISQMMLTSNQKLGSWRRYNWFLNMSKKKNELFRCRKSVWPFYLSSIRGAQSCYCRYFYKKRLFANLRNIRWRTLPQPFVLRDGHSQMKNGSMMSL